MALTTSLLPISLSAQEPARAFAPHDHWTRGILRRMALDGTIDASAATAAWPLREDVVAMLLSSAGLPGEHSDAPVEAGVRAALDDFATLFARERNDLLNHSALRLAVRGGLLFDGAWGKARAGTSVPDAAGYLYPGPTELDDRREVGALVEVDAAWRALALRATTSPPFDNVRELYLSASFGGIALWGGRRGLSFGATPRGGIVLADAVRYDGGGIETAEAFRLPAFLRALGAVRVSQTIARMERSGAVAHPWFLATRIAFAPDARFAVGLNRAVIFGGEGNEAVNARRVFLMLLGFSDVSGKDSDFENQVASIDVYWRLPTSLPLAVYGEYGTEDTGLAFVHVPAVTLGVEAAPRRGRPWSASLEHVRFARSTRDYPEWYRHGALGSGWSDDGVLLGHPLGGHGYETAVGVRYDNAPGRLAAAVRITARDRGEENLFAPDREGGAFGGETSIVWLVAAGIRGELVGSVEGGENWSANRLRFSVIAAF